MEYAAPAARFERFPSLFSIQERFLPRARREPAAPMKLIRQRLYAGGGLRVLENAVHGRYPAFHRGLHPDADDTAVAAGHIPIRRLRPVRGKKKRSRPEIEGCSLRYNTSG